MALSTPAARQPGSGYPKQMERGLISLEKQGMLILAVGSPHWYSDFDSAPNAQVSMRGSTLMDRRRRPMFA